MIRPLIDSDIPILKAIYERAGLGEVFPDFDSPLIEMVAVAVDEHDSPIGAVVGQRALHLSLILGEGHPAERFSILREFHSKLSESLCRTDYNEVDVFIPPQLESFGRRLQKSFGWVSNWRSFCFHLRKRV
jgi:hypothetical protein